MRPKIRSKFLVKLSWKLTEYEITRTRPSLKACILVNDSLSRVYLKAGANFYSRLSISWLLRILYMKWLKFCEWKFFMYIQL